MARSFAAPALAGLLPMVAAVASADIEANIVDLGTLGGEYSVATAVNASGQVAGIAQIPDEIGGALRPFLYDHGTMLNLGTFGGNECQVRGLNDAGQVAGYCENENGRERAFLYSDGMLTNLGTLGGPYSEAWDINESGQVVGYADTLAGPDHAFLYSAGVMTDLGTLGGDYSYALAINDAGQVTGYADTLTQRRAFRYNGGVMEDLGTLGGSQSLGFAINAAGDVVGSSRIVGDSADHAFYYDSGNDVMEDIGTLGGSYANAYHVNSSGQVAGDSLLAGDSEYHAFLYTDGVMVDLSTPGTTWAYVSHLGESGEVLFTETDADTFERRAWYYKDGVRIPIGALGGLYSEGLDMNDSGIVVGTTWPPTPSDGQHAFMTSCPQLPSTTCNAGLKAALQIKNDADDTRDKLQWKWAGGDAVAQGDLGNPASGTSYALCVYDSSTNADSLVSVLRSGTGDDWRDKDPKGWSYRDGDAAHHGIVKLQVKTGASGSTKAQLVARGPSIPMPAAANAGEMFDSDPDVNAQLHNDSTGMCWTTTFAAPRFNEPARYSARLP